MFRWIFNVLLCSSLFIWILPWKKLGVYIWGLTFFFWCGLLWKFTTAFSFKIFHIFLNLAELFYFVFLCHFCEILVFIWSLLRFNSFCFFFFFGIVNLVLNNFKNFFVKLWIFAVNVFSTNKLFVIAVWDYWKFWFKLFCFVQNILHINRRVVIRFIQGLRKSSLFSIVWNIFFAYK